MTEREFYNELAKILEMPAEDVRADTILTGREAWDSLGVLSFVALCDEKLGVQLAVGVLANCTTAADLAKAAGVL